MYIRASQEEPAFQLQAGSSSCSFLVRGTHEATSSFHPWLVYYWGRNNYQYSGLGFREELPTFWFHIPYTIMVYGTSNGPQNDIGNYLGP